MSDAGIEVRGPEMYVQTTSRLSTIAAPFIGLLGAALVVFTFQGAKGDAVLVCGLVGPLCVGGGLYFGFLRKQLVLHRDLMLVTIAWSWLGLRGRRSVDARGKRLLVERFTRRSDESGDTDFFRILLGEDVLHTLSEHQGGADAAERLAKRMAEHLGLSFGGQRDCKAMLRREALAAKLALAPLLVVLVTTLVMTALVIRMVWS